jgi:hypothetical protein
MGTLEELQMEIERRTLSGGGWASGSARTARIETTCNDLIALGHDQEPARGQANAVPARKQNPDARWPAFEGPDREGWPKLVLHCAGIHESVLHICTTFRPHFVIADAIVAMEGDCNLNCIAKTQNTVLLSDAPVTADFTLSRIVGSDPATTKHIREASRFLGNPRGTIL